MRANSRPTAFLRTLVGIGLVSSLTTLPPANTHALDQQALQQLQQQNACPGCDLSGATLSGVQLTGSRLMGANLQGADLRGAALINVDLSNADLRDADLSGALLQNTWLRGAMLSGVEWQGTVFAGADLSAATGLEQFRLNQACDDRSANLSSLPIPFSLPPCR